MLQIILQHSFPYVVTVLSAHGLDGILQRAVAIEHLCDHTVAQLDLSGNAGDLLGQTLEILDLVDRQLGLDEGLFQLLILAIPGVDGDAALGDDHVDGSAGRGDAQAAVNDQRKSRAGQRRDDDGKLRARGGITVTAGAAHDEAVGVGVTLTLKSTSTCVAPSRTTSRLSTAALRPLTPAYCVALTS